MSQTYIEANLVNSFIKSLKFFLDTLILFVLKIKDDFYLYINSKLNNLIIRNYYFFIFIDKLFNCQNYTKYFT